MEDSTIDKMNNLNISIFVEGHILSRNNQTNSVYVLVRISDNFWESKWFNADEVCVRSPSSSLNDIFSNQ